MDFVRLGDHPFAVLVVAALLRHLADIDFGVEVRGEGHAMVAGIAVHDIEVVDFVEMMLGGVGSEDGRYARVETAAEDGRQSGSLEAVLIGPLPRILEMRLVLRLVVGRIEVVAAALEAGIHNRQVLIGKRHVDHDVGLERAEQFAQLGHVVGIDLRRLHPVTADGSRHGVAFGFGTAGQHHVRKNRIGSDFLGHDRSDASGADNQSSTHSIFRVKSFLLLAVQKYHFILVKQKYSLHLHHQIGTLFRLARENP